MNIKNKLKQILPDLGTEIDNLFNNIFFEIKDMYSKKYRENIIEQTMISHIKKLLTPEQVMDFCIDLADLDIKETGEKISKKNREHLINFYKDM